MEAPEETAEERQKCQYCWHVDLQIVMITARLRGLGRENKGQPEARNKFLYSDMGTHAVGGKVKNRVGALEA